MSQVSYYTEEGLQNLKDEIKQLETIERPKISQQIAEARDKGDLSENAEYDAAKEAQGMLEARIANLKNKLSTARLIDDSKLDSSKVLILSKVKIYDVIYRTFNENNVSNEVSIESINDIDRHTRIEAQKVVKSIS